MMLEIPHPSPRRLFEVNDLDRSSSPQIPHWHSRIPARVAATWRCEKWCHFGRLWQDREGLPTVKWLSRFTRTPAWMSHNRERSPVQLITITREESCEPNVNLQYRFFIWLPRWSFKFYQFPAGGCQIVQVTWDCSGLATFAGTIRLQARSRDKVCLVLSWKLRWITAKHFRFQQSNREHPHTKDLHRSSSSLRMHRA